MKWQLCRVALSLSNWQLFISQRNSILFLWNLKVCHRVQQVSNWTVYLTIHLGPIYYYYYCCCIWYEISDMASSHEVFQPKCLHFWFPPSILCPLLIYSPQWKLLYEGKLCCEFNNYAAGSLACNLTSGFRDTVSVLAGSVVTWVWYIWITFSSYLLHYNLLTD